MENVHFAAIISKLTNYSCSWHSFMSWKFAYRDARQTTNQQATCIQRVLTEKKYSSLVSLEQMSVSLDCAFSLFLPSVLSLLSSELMPSRSLSVSLSNAVTSQEVLCLGYFSLFLILAWNAKRTSLFLSVRRSPYSSWAITMEVSCHGHCS